MAGLSKVDPKKLNYFHVILLAASGESINIESLDLKSQSPSRDVDNMHGGEVSFYDLGILFPAALG